MLVLTLRLHEFCTATTTCCLAVRISDAFVNYPTLLRGVLQRHLRKLRVALQTAPIPALCFLTYTSGFNSHSARSDLGECL